MTGPTTARESNTGGTLTIDAGSGEIFPDVPPRALAPEPEPSMRFELTPDATVIARDARSHRTSLQVAAGFFTFK